MFELNDAAEAEYEAMSAAREQLNRDDKLILQQYVKSHNGQ